MKTFFIAYKKIGDQCPCFIIAEAGVNHNGNLELALQLVDEAAKAGADAVKFQTFKASEVVTEKGAMAPYQERNMGIKESQRKMLCKLELPENFYPLIIAHCKEKKIIFLSTPHGGEKAVDFLETLNVAAYKIGSGDLTNYLLLEKVSQTKKPMILATGMGTLPEVQDAVSFIESHGNNKIVILHCTTNYPCPPDEVNMAAMATLIREAGDNIIVGYSDHTEGLPAAQIAAAIGAKVYECHFTLDRNLPGPDHAASVEPDKLRERIQEIRRIESLDKKQRLAVLTTPEAKLRWGDAKKQPVESEKIIMVTVRKSIVATHFLKKGTKICREDLTAKRPGDGTSPIEFQKFLGRELKRNIKTDEQLFFTDFVTS